jgi:hypothetical protein
MRFLVCFLPAWIHLGLNVKSYWFLNFNNFPSILDNYIFEVLMRFRPNLLWDS